MKKLLIPAMLLFGLPLAAQGGQPAAVQVRAQVRTLIDADASAIEAAEQNCRPTLSVAECQAIWGQLDQVQEDLQNELGMTWWDGFTEAQAEQMLASAQALDIPGALRELGLMPALPLSPEERLAATEKDAARALAAAKQADRK